MLAKMGLFVVNDLAPINAVLQHQVKRTAGKWFATGDAARGAGPQLALDAPGVQLVLQQPDRAEFCVAAKDQAHDFRLAFDDDELAVLRPIPERRHPAHPHPIPFRGGDLVANAFADDLALELRVSVFWLLIIAADFFFDGGSAIMGPYAAGGWPSSLRTSGMGSAYGFGGIGKIIGPIGLALIVGSS